MALQFEPYSGQILRCDFTGLLGNEMSKHRPVVVISKRAERYKKSTCMIVCLSTTVPRSVEKYHMQLSLPMPRPDKLSPTCWVKGDMVYSVSLYRLEMYRLGTQGGRRQYYKERVCSEGLFKVRQCVANAIGFTC